MHAYVSGTSFVQDQLSSTVGRRTTVSRTLGQGIPYSSSPRLGASLAGDQQQSSNSRSSSPGARTGDGSPANLSPLRRTTAGGAGSPLRQGWATSGSPSRGGTESGLRSGGGATGGAVNGVERGSSSPMRPSGAGGGDGTDPGSPVRQGWGSSSRSNRAGVGLAGEAASLGTGSPLRREALGRQRQQQQQQDQVMAWGAVEEPSSPVGGPEAGGRLDGGEGVGDNEMVGTWQEQLGSGLPPTSFNTSLQQSTVPASSNQVKRPAWGGAEGVGEVQQQPQPEPEQQLLGREGISQGASSSSTGSPGLGPPERSGGRLRALGVRAAAAGAQLSPQGSMAARAGAAAASNPSGQEQQPQSGVEGLAVAGSPSAGLSPQASGSTVGGVAGGPSKEEATMQQPAAAGGGQLGAATGYSRQLGGQE